MDGRIKPGVVDVKTAASVLRVDPQTVRLLLQNKLVDWGCAYKRPGSRQFSYIIYAEPFCKLTGYRHNGTGNEVYANE